MITVLHGGCTARHPSSFQISRPDGLPNYVILIVHTAGKFFINGKHYFIFPGHALIIAPHTAYSYGNPDGNYIDDWIHFTTDTPSVFTNDSLPVNVPFPVANTELFTFLIKQIIWENSYGDPDCAQQNIDSLFSVLLNHLSTSFKTKDQKTAAAPYQRQLQSLRLELRDTLTENPSIESCASQLGISTSYFQHLYRDFFGISFQKDLIRIRVEQAKYILLTTNLTLEQISELCGYSSAVHFYRQFKQVTGTTPASYRKNLL